MKEIKLEVTQFSNNDIISTSCEHEGTKHFYCTSSISLSGKFLLTGKGFDESKKYQDNYIVPPNIVESAEDVGGGWIVPKNTWFYYDANYGENGGWCLCEGDHSEYVLPKK